MKCVLHIGTEKTGTTLLQEWLQLNAAALSAQGIALSEVLGGANNWKLVACYIDHPTRVFDGLKSETPEAARAHLEETLERFSAEIEQKSGSHEVFVVTSEHFHRLLRTREAIAALHGFLARHFSEIKIVCYFREQSELKQSLYSTALRVGRKTAIAEFHKDAGADNLFFNYHAMLSNWAEVFSRENIVPVLYDRSRFADGDLRKDFLLRVKPGVVLDGLDYRIDTANEKLTEVQAAVIRALNGAVPDFSRAGVRNADRRLILEAIERSDRLRIGAIADPNRVEFSERFRESNKAFFETFFDGETGFPTPGAAAGGAEEEAVYRRSDVARIVSDVVTEIARQLTERSPSDAEVDRLREVAMKYETGERLSREDAIAIMRMAQRHHPGNMTVDRKLRQWQGGTGASEKSGARLRDFAKGRLVRLARRLGVR